MNEFANNAKFALVIVERPKLASDEEEKKKWNDFLGSVRQNAKPNKETTLINDNVWLIPLDSGMRFLAQFFEVCAGADIPLRILFLDAEPDWLQYPKPS
jgi:hypothetical protein